MPRTYGSFEDLLYKLNDYSEHGWDGEICIKTRTYEHHVPTNHYYKRKFNKQRSEDTGKLEVDIEGENGELYRDISIKFEDLKDGKYLISASNFSANNIECQGITPDFWWIYEENPRINAKGGKRRKSRKKRGKGQIFSSLKKLHEKLLDKTDDTNRIFFKIENGEVESGKLLSLQDMYVQEVLPVLQDGPLRLTKLKWSWLKRGDIKVKIKQDEDWWQYYEEGAKGGCKKTRKKRGKGQIFSRRRNSMIGKQLKKPEDGTIWEIIREQNGIVHLRELTDGTGGTGDGFVLGPIDLSILQQIGWKFEGISSSSGSSGGRKRKTRKKAPIKISCNFDSGNIIHKKTKTIKDKNIFTLEIKKDPYPKSVKKKYQNWYYFKVENAKGKKCKFIIENLVNIDNDWKGHNVVFTYNHKDFNRHPTVLKNNTLSWEFTPKKNKVYFSYYVPYCLSRNYKLTSKLSKRSGIKKSILGKSPLKNKIEVLKFGKGDKNIFMIVRQHPGETISSWMFEGFISAFFSPRSTKMRNKLINKFTFHIFPLANPDGVALGHWYTQSHGHNCNRQWYITKCPEVKMIRNYIEKQGNGCLYIDLHGDEGCKRHFITGNGKEKDDKHSPYNFFRKRMVEYNKHFQLKDYYTVKLHKVHGTFDGAWNNSLTVEGCMKHSYNRQSLELEPLKIGKHLFKSLYDWSFI